MSHIAAGSSGDHSRDKQITLPPIRDIFREQLTSPSPQSSPRPPRPSYNSGSVRSAFADESSSYTSTSSRAPSASPDMRYFRGESPWGSTPSPRNAPSGLRSSRSYGAASPEVSSRWPMSEHAGSHRSSPALPATQPYPPASGYRYVAREAPGHYYGAPSGPASVDDPRSTTAVSSVWIEHRRRDSAESAWSSHSSSSGASSGLRSIPPSNALQFQPLPHAQMASAYPRPQNHTSTHHPANIAPVDYQSPFGVLIADVDPPGVSSADPQRTAIIRTLRASGAQGSFQISFDDPANAHNTPRYSCQYCGKGFARPSSLRIHNNSHTGEKPFACTHAGCDRRFSVHSNMRRHARVHEGETPRQGESSGDEVADE